MKSLLILILAGIAQAATPDFTVAVSPGSQTAGPGISTSYTVTVSANNGFSGRVDLSASGIPAGASATFNPASVTGHGTSVMTITTPALIATSTAGITVTGAAAVHSYRVTLTTTSPTTTTTNGYYVAPNGNDSWTGRLPAPNSGNTDGPFATLARAQTAMQLSTLKTTYIRAGTYFPPAATTGDGCLWGQSVSISMTAGDSGETWSYYPPDGYNTAILDGGAPAIPQTGQASSSIGTGTGCAFSDDFASNVTITGLQFRNYRLIAVWANGSPWGQATPTISNVTVSNNVVHDTRLAAFGADGLAMLNCVPNSTVTNNYIYNIAYVGIGVGNAGVCTGGSTNDVIANNVIINSCTWAAFAGGDQDGGDCGGIYIQDTKSSNIQVTNNYIRDVNVSSNGAGDFTACCTLGIYLDVASNVTVTGNVVTGIHSACFQLHGDNNHVTGNICDEGPVGPRFIAIYLTTDTANGVTSVGNTFQNNIVTGASAGGGYTAQTLAGTPVKLSISNNAYWNYGGGAMNTGGDSSAGNDASPVTVNPGISCWAAGVAAGSPVLSSPVNFPAIKGNWGPPGFVIPQTGTAPAWPHGC